MQGSQTSLPGITFGLTPTALAKGGGFGSSSPDSFIRIQVGGAEGGFITAEPKGVGGDKAVIFLGGGADVRPFYDRNGKLSEIRIFYNGDAPRTPQEAGALAAVIALIEEARHARFEEAVRTGERVVATALGRDRGGGCRAAGDGGPRIDPTSRKVRREAGHACAANERRRRTTARPRLPAVRRGGCGLGGSAIGQLASGRAGAGARRASRC